MKKQLLSLALALIMCLALVPVATLAAPNQDIRVLLDGRLLTFDVPPQIVNDRVIIPLRAIFEAMGARVGWDGDTQAVIAANGNSSVVVRLTIGNPSPTINDEVVEIDQPGVIVNGRTLAPLRFVCEAFGGDVVWDETARTITITSEPGAAEPLPPMPLPEFPVIDGSSSTEIMHAAIRANLIDEYYIVRHSQTYAALERLVPGDDNPADVVLAVKYYDDTLADVKSRGANLVITPIAKEGFVFVVHADNPVDSLTRQQLRDIYSGKITNWKEVGGRDEDIKRLTRNWDSGSQTAMESFMGDVPISEGLGTTIDTASSMGEMLDAVTAVDWAGSSAIGYNIYSWVMEQRVGNSDLKLLAVGGVSPSNKTLADDSYPLRVSTYSYYNKGNEMGKKLTGWLLTDDGQKAITSAGYVGIFGELPPNEPYGYGHFNRDHDDAMSIVYDFYEEHKLISSFDGTSYIRRGSYSIERLNNRSQAEELANGKGKDMTELYLFRGDGDYGENGVVYKYLRFIVLTREKGGTFEVINEGEVLSFDDGKITTSGVDSHIERFPVETDYYTESSLEEHPNAFRGYIPDFAALGLTVSESYNVLGGYLTLKNGTPYSFYIYVETSEESYLTWHISTDPNYISYISSRNLHELKSLTEQFVLDEIDSNNSIVFTWKEHYFVIQAWNPKGVWAVVQQMQRMALS